MQDLAKIPYIQSPNKSARTAKPTYIIIHAMNGTFLGSQAWFKNPESQVSAHYLVSKKGELMQMVQCRDKAWHVKNFNNQSIGIELEDYDPKTRKTCVTDPAWCTQVEYEAAASLTAALMKANNIPLTHVIGHNDPMLKKLGNNHTDPGSHFDWIKFKALVQGFLYDGNKSK